jgi:hypothetical protein
MTDPPIRESVTELLLHKSGLMRRGSVMLKVIAIRVAKGTPSSCYGKPFLESLGNHVLPYDRLK